jgi:hypothetical protein
MPQWKATIIWLVIAAIAARIVSHLSDLNFWICLPIAAAALALNGWLADREDRGKFND